MSVGTGIFLSALLLALIQLFAVTKDRWNWKRIAKWGLLTPLALAAIACISLYVYVLWDARPSPQTAFNEIPLQAHMADVKFSKGEPATKEGADRWVYKVGSGPGGKDAAQILVQFKDGRIRFILYAADEREVAKPYLLGFTIGSSYKDIEDKLGQPSDVSKSADDLSRIFSYKQLNAFFSFSEGHVVAYGIYQPTDGPMSFRTESEPLAEK